MGSHNRHHFHVGRISRVMRQGNSITHGNTPLADAARSSLLPSLISRVYHLPRDCLGNFLIVYSSPPPLYYSLFVIQLSLTICIGVNTQYSVTHPPHIHRGSSAGYRLQLTYAHFHSIIIHRMFAHHSPINQCTTTSLFVPRHLSLFSPPYPILSLAASVYHHSLVSLSFCSLASLIPSFAAVARSSLPCLSLSSLLLRSLTSPSSFCRLSLFALPVPQLLRRLACPPPGPALVTAGGGVPSPGVNYERVCPSAAPR